MYILYNKLNANTNNTDILNDIRDREQKNTNCNHVYETIDKKLLILSNKVYLSRK